MAKTNQQGLLERERAQRLLAEALRRAVAAISSTLDYEEVLDRILQEVHRVVVHDAANIMLIEGDEARAFRWHGYDQFGVEAQVDRGSFKVADFPNLRRQLESGRPVVMPYVQEEDWTFRSAGAWIKSYAGAPIRIRERVIGFLNVNSATPGFFKQADAEQLQAFADQAAIAIENARLFEAERRRRQEAETLREAAMALTTGLDLKEVFETLLTQLERVITYDSVAVLLVRGERLNVVATRGHPHLKQVLGYTYEADNELLARMEQSGRPVIVDDAGQDPCLPPWSQAGEVRGWMGVPLIARRKVIGYLTLNNHRPAAYGRAEADLVQPFASQAAVAIENTRLFQKARLELAQRRQVEEELGKYRAHLEELVVERTAELQQANEQLKKEIAVRQRVQTALQRANQELQRLAILDGLTQVSNRHRFDEYLEEAWQWMLTTRSSLSLILGDIDYFKRYNDTYGHQAGDVCLRQVAQAINRAAPRAEDLVARYGGEEFVVILLNTGPEAAMEVAKAIQAEVHRLQIPHEQSGVSRYVTLSIGVASGVPDLAHSPAAFLATADAALYETKAQGRNRIILKTELVQPAE